MTSSTKAAIDAVNKATQGEWRVEGGSVYAPDGYIAEGFVAALSSPRGFEQRDNDCAAIVAAVNLLRDPTIQARLLGGADREAVARIVGAVAANGALCGWAVDELIALLSRAPTTPAGSIVPEPSTDSSGIAELVAEGRALAVANAALINGAQNWHHSASEIGQLKGAAHWVKRLISSLAKSSVAVERLSARLGASTEAHAEHLKAESGYIDPDNGQYVGAVVHPKFWEGRPDDN